MAKTQDATMKTEAGRRALLLYDGECPLCQRSVKVLKRLDWLHRLEYFDARQTATLPAVNPPLDPARLLEGMHLVTPDRRRVHHGFSAFRWLAWRLPLLWLIAPLLYLPGVPRLGAWTYRWIGRRRLRGVSSRTEGYELPRQPVVLSTRNGKGPLLASSLNRRDPEKGR